MDYLIVFEDKIHSQIFAAAREKGLTVESLLENTLKKNFKLTAGITVEVDHWGSSDEGEDWEPDDD